MLLWEGGKLLIIHPPQYEISAERITRCEFDVVSPAKMSLQIQFKYDRLEISIDCLVLRTLSDLRRRTRLNLKHPVFLFGSAFARQNLSRFRSCSQREDIYHDTSTTPFFPHCIAEKGSHPLNRQAPAIINNGVHFCFIGTRSVTFWSDWEKGTWKRELL